MSRLYCPVCTFGCNDQDSSWVDHFLSKGHRIKQSLNQLWNWPLEKDRRALVFPIPDRCDFPRRLLHHLHAFTLLPLTRIIHDFLVDEDWNVAIVLLKNRESAEMLRTKASAPYSLQLLQMEEPIWFKSKYFLRNSQFDTLQKFRLGQPRVEDEPENSALMDISSTLDNMKKAPLDLNQQLIYLLENYAVTLGDAELQEDIFKDLKALLQQEILMNKMVLAGGGVTHFGYKFDAIDVEITVPYMDFFEMDLSIIAAQSIISASESFQCVSSAVATRADPPLAKSFTIRHTDLRILINLTLTDTDDPDVFGPRLLYFLMTFDKRAAPLLNFLQLWNTQRKIGMPSSTIFNLVVVFLTSIGAIPSINFLQNLVPTAQKDNKHNWDFSIFLDEKSIEKEFHNIRTVGVNKEVDGFQYDAKDVLGWAGKFFKMFMLKEARLSESVLCLLTGQIIPRSKFQPLSEHLLPANLKRKYLKNPSTGSCRGLSERLNISSDQSMVTQHPFILSRNVTPHISLAQVQRFHQVCGIDFNIMKRVLVEGRKVVHFFEDFKLPVHHRIAFTPEKGIKRLTRVPTGYKKILTQRGGNI